MTSKQVSSGAKILEETSLENIEELKELVQSLLGHVSQLEEQVETQGRMTPGWMTGEEMYAQYDPSTTLSSGAGQEEGDAGQMLFGTDSHPIPELILKTYGPKFRMHSRVRINPEVKVRGSEKLWGSVLGAENLAGIGVVTKVMYMDNNGEWKYRVRIKGLTGKMGSGYHESELMPIKRKVTKYVVEE